MNGQCETCGRGCDDRDSYCDSCWEEISCEDTPQEYIPTDQDLLDMEVAFAVNPVEIFERLEAMDLSSFKSFAAKLDFDLDDPF